MPQVCFCNASLVSPNYVMESLLNMAAISFVGSVYSFDSSLFFFVSRQRFSLLRLQSGLDSRICDLKLASEQT